MDLLQQEIEKVNNEKDTVLLELSHTKEECKQNISEIQNLQAVLEHFQRGIYCYTLCMYYTYMYIHTYVRTYTHTHTHTHTQSHTHTHTYIVCVLCMFVHVHTYLHTLTF